jgi:hypothetical protein
LSALSYLNNQLSTIHTNIDLLTLALAIPDPQIQLKIFLQCWIQKLPHLLGCNILYHHTCSNDLLEWTDWDGLLAAATNHIISNFLSTLLHEQYLPNHAMMISQLIINTGGLGIIYPRSRTIPGFMLTLTTSLCHATSGIKLNKLCNNIPLHHTISSI